MAKISARGATKVATVTSTNGVIWTLTSDGRILRKALPGDAYTIRGHIKHNPITRETLIRVLAQSGIHLA